MESRALLDHGGQRLLTLGGGEGGALLNGLVLEGVFDEAQRGGALAVVGLHGGDNGLTDQSFQCACVHGVPFLDSLIGMRGFTPATEIAAATGHTDGPPSKIVRLAAVGRVGAVSEFWISGAAG